MTGSKISQIKPGVNRSVHLFATAFLWTAIGSLLLIRGARWIGLGSAGWFVISGLIAGTLKSLFILDKTAGRSVQRIVELQDGTCIGAVYSWKTWMLVGLDAGRPDDDLWHYHAQVDRSGHGHWNPLCHGWLGALFFKPARMDAVTEMGAP